MGTISASGTQDFLREHFFKDIKGYPNVTAGLAGLAAGELDAFMHDAPILQYRLKEQTNKGSIALLPIQFNTQFYAFALPKGNSALEKKISQRILELMETKAWEVVLNEYNLSPL